MHNFYYFGPKEDTILGLGWVSKGIHAEWTEKIFEKKKNLTFFPNFVFIKAFYTRAGPVGYKNVRNWSTKTKVSCTTNHLCTAKKQILTFWPIFLTRFPIFFARFGLYARNDISGKKNWRNWTRIEGVIRNTSFHLLPSTTTEKSQLTIVSSHIGLLPVFKTLNKLVYFNWILANKLLLDLVFTLYHMESIHFASNYS